METRITILLLENLTSDLPSKKVSLTAQPRHLVIRRDVACTPNRKVTGGGSVLFIVCRRF